MAFTSERVQFIRFLVLPTLWARQSGLTPEMVLGRLCGWAVAGGFPERAFVNATGAAIDELEIYLSWKGFANPNPSGSVSIGNWTFCQDRTQSLILLNSALVSTDSLLSFCDRTNTRLPPEIRGRRRSIRGWLFGREQLAPPECPQAYDLAVRRYARRSAEGWVNSLKTKLGSARGDPGYRPMKGDPLDFAIEHWQRDWNDAHARAQKDIQDSDAGDLKQEVERLQGEWRTFIEEQSRLQAENAARLEPELQTNGVYLHLNVAHSIIVIGGKKITVPPQSFQVLRLLAERRIQDRAIVSKTQIDDHLWGRQVARVKRETRDVIRELRDGLAKHLPRDEVKALIITHQGVGYELGLEPDQIQLS